jgi:hypothetical protein
MRGLVCWKPFEFKYCRLHGMNSDHCLHAALGAYDPHQEETLLSALDAHRVMHPDMGDWDFATSRTRSHEPDHGDIRCGAVMARESVLGRDASNPWGKDANDWCDRKSTGNEAASPNWW